MAKMVFDTARTALRLALLASLVALALSACEELSMDTDDVVEEPARDPQQEPARDLQQEEELVEDVEEAFEELETTLEIDEPEVDEVVTQLQTIEKADLEAAITGVATKLRAELAPLLPN